MAEQNSSSPPTRLQEESSKDPLFTSPAFQFYARDMLTDIRLLMMPASAIGIYVLMLCRCWLDGYVSSDVAVCARSILRDQAEVRDVWDALLPMFEVRGNTLVQPELETYRAERKAHAEKSARAGKRSGESRRTNRAVRVGLEPESNQPVEPKTNTSSSSSSSSSLAFAPSPAHATQEPRARGHANCARCGRVCLSTSQANKLAAALGGEYALERILEMADAVNYVLRLPEYADEPIDISNPFRFWDQRYEELIYGSQWFSHAAA